MIAVADAVAKMQTLSEDRVAHVVSLIENLAELEARENSKMWHLHARPLRMAKGLCHGKLAKTRLDALHGID